MATESGFKFFSITASSLTSKFVGESEKLMRSLFQLARLHQPCVVFFDEIDSILSSRKDNEHEASRRLKTEFMAQLDGALTNSEDKILIMGATNIPWGLDEAVLRRMAKRIYVPLPEGETRQALILHLLNKQNNGESEGGGDFSGAFELSQSDVQEIVNRTDGFSGSDLSAVSFLIYLFFFFFLSDLIIFFLIALS